MSQRLVLQIKRTDNSQFSVELESDSTVFELKQNLASRADIPIPQQRLVYKGQVLKDEQSLRSYGISEGSQVHLIRQTPSTTSAAPGTGGSLGSGLGGFQQHLIKHPDVMEAMMNSPQMQAMLGNPDMMRAVISMNPEIRQLTESHPELAHMLADSNFLAQTVDAFRSPAAMRELMRSTDRALANIDAVPGGFNALAKMYNDLDSSSSVAPTSSHAPTAAPSVHAANADAGIHGKPLPNPWTGGGGNFEPSAAAAMLQDPNMQALVANLFRSAPPPPPSAGQAAPAGASLGEAATIGRLFDPSFMALVSELERSIGSAGPAPPGAAAAGAAAGATAGAAAAGAGASFGNSFGTFMTAMSDNPEIKWRAQLAALRSMGFGDTGACVRALQQSNGNVNRAIDILIAESSSNA